MVPGIHGGAATSVWISQPTVDVNLIDGPPDIICNHDLVAVATYDFLDSKVHGANIEPIWGRQDPGGPYVDPMNLPIWVYCTHTFSNTHSYVENTYTLNYYPCPYQCSQYHGSSWTGGIRSWNRLMSVFTPSSSLGQNGPKFDRRHSRMHFLEWNSQNSNSNLTGVQWQ